MSTGSQIITPTIADIPKAWEHQEKARARAYGKDCFALFFEQGCLSRTAEVTINRGGNALKYSIEEVFRLFNHVELANNEKGFAPTISTRIRSMTNEGIRLQEIKGVYRSGEKIVWELKIAGCCPLRLTEEHKVFSQRGWVAAGELLAADKVACDFLTKHQAKAKQKKRLYRPYRYVVVGKHHPYVLRAQGLWIKVGDKKYWKKACTKVPLHRLVYEAKMNDLVYEDLVQATFFPNDLKFINPKEFHIHHKDHNSLNNDISNLELLTLKEHFQHHTKGYSNFEHGNISWRRVESFAFVGKEMTYDIQCAEPHHNFVANNIVVHNSGKTRTQIEILRDIYNRNKRYSPTLIFAPPVVVPNWKKEILLYSAIPESRIICLQGSAKERVGQAEEAQLKFEGGFIAITNYETLLMKDMFDFFLRWHPEIIVADESQRIKDRRAKRTKAIIKLGARAKYRYCLSGTPILNSPEDIFSQFLFLDKGETFGLNFFKFQATFMEDKNAAMRGRTQKYFPKWVARNEMLPKLTEMIERKSMRVLKSECLDLPPLVRQEVFVELSPLQRQLYNQMKKDYVAFLDSKACVATLAITKALRLMQICSGFIALETPQDERSTMAIEETPKMVALEELLSDLTPNHKVIVWAIFKVNYKEIAKVCQKLNLKYVELHGEVGPRQKQENIDAFQRDNDTRVLIGNPLSGGVGVNLVAASYAIYYSRNFSLEADLQSEARNHRGGSEQHEKITRIDLIARNTLDEYVVKQLRLKLTLSETVLRDYLLRD